jgi:hypothetical protein
MIFLIHYNRRNASIEQMHTFADDQLTEAENLRLDIELKAGPEHEVVSLEAPSKEHLLKTHSRYFQNVSQIADTLLKDLATRVEKL